MGRLDDFRKRMETRMSALRGDAPGGTGGAGGPPDTAALARYLTPAQDEMLQWWEAARGSVYVRANERYAACAAATVFLYAAGDDTVNAYASRTPEGGHRIVFFGGAMRFSRLASLAVAEDLCGRRGTAARFARAMEDFGGAMSPKLALEVLEDCGLDEGFSAPGVAGKAQAVSAGMVIGVLAHEMGHVCLGHVAGPNYYGTNLEVARNREREADSFASSVMASTPFGEYLYEGTLFWHAVLALQQGAEAVESTHPLERERLENLIRANPSKASALGIRLPV